MRREASASIWHRATPATWGLATAAAVAFLAIGMALPAQAADAPAAEQRPVREKCLGCHDDPEMKAEDGKSVAVLAADFDRSAHRKRDCGDCHVPKPLGAVKHPRNAMGAVSPQVCQDCHSDEFTAIAGSIHGRRAGGERAIKDCTGCHGSLHSVHKSGDPDSPLSATNQIKTCGGCHDEIMKGYEQSEHARALLKSGLTEAAPSCSSCHGKHDIHPKAATVATTNHANIPETCGKCHTSVLREWKDSAHGTLWQAGKQGPVCSTCHTAHAIKRPDSAAVRAELPQECGNCHEKVYASFHDSFHGKATSLEHRKAAICSDCHTPHHNLPASDPRSSINKANLATTCGACHAGVNEKFLSFDPHANPSDPSRNKYVYWIWLAMTGLLLGVFAFFGLHDILWLQRAIVGKMRGEFKFGHGGPGQYVRRFSRMQMGIHVTIVLSFLLLAATGLPLKFAAASWAPGVMALFGGAEMAGHLHRFAAIVTFSYFAVHLGMLVYGWFVKKERGYFWGPRSMTPQPRDIQDLWHMFRYFLYIGERPKFDRFTYWEKFDYLAVFWGVAIIGLSGLVLWQPTLATKLLPGWVLNAAYVMHSDEALLATGFIFLFHFFHTHLRPEAFPMDPVIFTGRMPLERFKDERPLEYARAVAENRLESMLVAPPTKGKLRRAYLFGFTAMFAGIVLAVFIFRALLAGLLH